MGGSTSKAPQAYTPANQPGADSNYSQLVNSAMPWATALPGQVIPGLNQAATNVGNNPYNAGALAGATGVSNLAINGVAPNMLNANSSLYGLGDLASMYAGAAGQGGQYANPMLAGALGTGQGALGTGQQALGAGANAMNAGQQAWNQAYGFLPQATSGMSVAPTILQSGQAKADKLWNETQTAIPGLTTGGNAAAQQMLSNGFDPQGALYNRNFQQMQDQQNALNSMYGLGNSAFGAGVAGNAATNFNLDWQNQQEQRQIAALGAYDTHTGQVTSNLTNLLNTGASGWSGLSNSAVGSFNGLTNSAVNNATNLINTAGNQFQSGVGTNLNAMNTNLNAANTNLNAMNTGANAYNSMMNGAVDRFGNMINAAGNAYQSGASQGVNALNTLATATQLPSNTYNQQQMQWIQALQALASGGGASLSPMNPLIQANGDYLRIGQGATQLDQNATQINNAQSNAQWNQLMQGLGTIAGIAMGPLTGGMSLFSLAGSPVTRQTLATPVGDFINTPASLPSASTLTGG